MGFGFRGFLGFWGFAFRVLLLKGGVRSSQGVSGLGFVQSFWRVLALLGGSWYRFTNYTCTSNPLRSPEVPNMLISTVISTVNPKP